MEQISSIESRTRASFKRVKRDIDALKRQIAKLRERDEKLDHALSDYTRTGEFYERLKAIDERFDRLSDSFATADEFEKAVERIIKETTQLSKHLDKVERSDLSPEVASLRKELETLQRSVVEKPAFETFADKAAVRLEKLEDSVAAADRRLKALSNVEDRVEQLSKLESETKRLSEMDKHLKKLEGLDAKRIEARLDKVEKVHERFDPAQIDTRLEKLEKEREKTPLFDLNKRIQAVERTLGSLEQQGADVKRLDRLADRIDALESSAVSESKVKTIVDQAVEPFVKVDELNTKIDEFNAALETVPDADRLAQLESRLETERHATNAEVTALQQSIDGFETRVEGLGSELGSHRHETNAEISTFASDLNAISTRIEKLEKSPAGIDTKTLAESAARLDSLESELSERVDELASRLAEVERVASSEHVSPTDFDETSDRLAQFEASLADVRERMDEPSGDGRIAERLADIEAQNNAVLAELAEVSDSSMNSRVIEDMAGDLSKAQQRIEELAEEVELYTKSAKKGAEQTESVDHLQTEIEFLRNNVAMQDEIEALRAQIDTLSPAEGGNNRVTVLSDDLRKLFERQSELEKKVLSLETQNRQLRAKPQDPLWNETEQKPPSKPAKKRNVQLEEKVPLRGPKASQEPAPAEPIESEEADEDERKGRFGRFRKWMVDFFTEEVEDEKRKDELY